MALGMILTWLFYIAGNRIGPLPHLQSAGPFVVDSLGIAAAYLAPVARLWPRRPVAAPDEFGHLPFLTSSNILYEYLEWGIQWTIRKHMHKKITGLSMDYGWDTIKLAAKQALGLEMPLSSLSEKVYNSESKYIDKLPSGVAPNTDSTAKYYAFTHVLSNCNFRELLYQLREATKENRR
jgi:hypothetical protein